MTTLFKRKAGLTLIIGDNAIDVSQFRFTFHIEQGDEQGPNTGTIRVYNLAEAVVNQVQNELQGQVIVQAGYEGQYGVIFHGDIRQWRKGRENHTDTYLDILASDGDLAYINSAINKTFPAGTTKGSALIEQIAAMKHFGVTDGYKPVAGDQGVFLRSKTTWGLVRSHLRNLATSLDATWSIQNGEFRMTPLSGYNGGDLVVLNSATGLLGRPEVTGNGVEARCLINPRLRVGNAVQIDQASINRIGNAGPGNPYIGISFDRYKDPAIFPRTDADGKYRILSLEYEGDTWGVNWFAYIIGLSIAEDTNKVPVYP